MKSSVTTIAARRLSIFELSARPKATESEASRKSQTNAITTSIAETPPNKNGSAPTGASITMYIAMLVKAAKNLPRAMMPGPRPVSSSASQVRPSRSEAMLFEASAGPARVTTKYASEKKVWKTATPVLAGSSESDTKPPMLQSSSAAIAVTDIKMNGVRVSRVDCLSSRMRMGFGADCQWSTCPRTRAIPRDSGGGGGSEVLPVWTLIAGLRGSLRGRCARARCARARRR